MLEGHTDPRLAAVHAVSTNRRGSLGMGRGLQFCQLAISTMSLGRSHRWYREVLGFLPAGERRHREGGMYAAVPGLPEASFDVWCLVGRQKFLQIEMFEFARPVMRRRPSGWRPCDVGYSSFAIHVGDFDSALQRLAAIGERPEAYAGPAGRRQVCFRDPDGIALTLLEEMPCPALSSGPAECALPAIVSVTLSVPSVERARDFWVHVLGCRQLDRSVGTGSAQDLLWELAGAPTEALLLASGNVIFELVQYASPPSRLRPADYRISDQGILNVAFGSTDKQDFDEAYERTLRHGFRGHTEPWTLPGIATVVYLSDPNGFSVELLHVEPAFLERMGFRAA